MALYCPDGTHATFPPPTPPPKPERGAPWCPPDTSSSTCQRCGRPSWQHRSHPPVLADEIDRAIYAAAFVRGLDFADVKVENSEAVSNAARSAVVFAEMVVELHRRARSGT